MQINLADSSQPIRLVQITDCHLGASAGDDLLGLDTDYSLEQVIGLVREQQGTPDLLLATGDLSNHGHIASYERFLTQTAGLARHTAWLPGNHDSQELMREAVTGDELSRTIRAGNWLVVMLDSTVAGEVGGSFSEQELAFLEQCLQQGAAHVLVCLHHHPVPIGCEWLDEQQVANADAFFAILDRYRNVRGVVWGHVHQQLDTERKGVKLMSTPSSCIQFAPDSAGFKLDRLNPGYRALQLHADGRIDSQVQRVTAVDFQVNYDSAEGY